MSEMFQCCDCGCPTPNSFDLGRLLNNPHYIIHRCDGCQTKLDLKFKFQYEGATYNTRDMICPWCGYLFADDEAWRYVVDGGGHEVQCPACVKHFDLEVENRPRFSTKRSLCDMPEGWTPEDDDAS